MPSPRKIIWLTLLFSCRRHSRDQCRHQRWQSLRWSWLRRIDHDTGHCLLPSWHLPHHRPDCQLLLHPDHRRSHRHAGHHGLARLSHRGNCSSGCRPLHEHWQYVIRGCGTEIPLMKPGPELNFQATNVFFRQLRNLVFDTRAVRGAATGIHWPSSQATLVQNCVFRLSSQPGDIHTGIFMEEGSGGMMADLVFHGGKYGARFGNQQYTMRNLTFYGSDTAIEQIWNWGWTYKSLKIVGSRVGINMSSTDVGSVTLLDSSFVNVTTALITGRTPGNTTGLGSLVIQNVEYKNVPTVLEGADGEPLLMGDSNGTVYDGGYARVSYLRALCH